MDGNELAEAWKDYSPRLILIARAITTTSSNHLAEDAVQEAFLQLARQNVVPDDPIAWLVRVTRNKIMQWQRSGQRRVKREQSKFDPRWFLVDHEAVDRSLDAQAVTDALKHLAEEQRQVIVMHLWGEMKFSTIGDALGIFKSSAHRAFQTGISAMRKRFEPTSGHSAEVTRS